MHECVFIQSKCHTIDSQSVVLCTLYLKRGSKTALAPRVFLPFLYFYFSFFFLSICHRYLCYPLRTNGKMLCPPILVAKSNVCSLSALVSEVSFCTKNCCWIYLGWSWFQSVLWIQFLSYYIKKKNKEIGKTKKSTQFSQMTNKNWQTIERYPGFRCIFFLLN